MSKSKLDIFVTVAERLKRTFRINGHDTDGSTDVVVDRLGLTATTEYTPAALYAMPLAMDSGYLVFRALATAVDDTGRHEPDVWLTCTCTLGADKVTLMAVTEDAGDVYIYTASPTDTTWTLKSKVGRADGSVQYAEQLATARSINGTAFDGTKDIVTSNWGPSVDFTVNGDINGSSLSQKGTGPITINATLVDSGVAAGTYSKVTVDKKGRVTTGSVLLASDIPYITAAHIQSGVFTSDRIPFLPAEKITTGTLSNDRLSTRVVTGDLASQTFRGEGATRLKIRLPWTLQSYLMVSFNVTVYNAFVLNRVTVSGYLYADVGQWYIPRVHQDSDQPMSILMGIDGDGIAYVSVPVNSYYGIRVHDLTIGYSQNLDVDLRAEGWEIISDVTTPNSVEPTYVTNVRSDNIQWYTAGAAGYLTTPRTINGTAFNGTENIVTSSWGTGRSLTLSGDAHGTVWWDGAANVNMTVSLGDGVTPKTAIWLGGNNLNDITAPGFYYNPADAQAMPSLNYPQHHAGSLRVYLAAGVVQEYTTYSGGGHEKYVRGLYNGSWSGWRRLANNSNVNDLVTSVAASKVSGVLSTANIPTLPTSHISGLGNLAGRTMYISTAEPNNATGAEGDLWGVIQ